MSDVSRSYPTANAPVAISPGAANGMSNNNSNNTNKSSLFVGDLSIFCNEQELQEEFSKYGEVVEIKIMKSEETNRNLCYGFIKFSNPISAKNALDNLDGKVLRGRRMRFLLLFPYPQNKSICSFQPPSTE
jgi:RNA recognition motif-containing protein